MVSYPYEWPFGMLREAALLELDLLLAGLDEGLVLKDASPYNVQWRGSKPVFVDVGSFERLREERALGRLPAILHARPLPPAAPGLQNVPFQPWLRGSWRESSPARCARSWASRTASAAAS